MTVSYQYDVASSTSGGLLKLLIRWRGSIWKLLFREGAIFVAAYMFLAFSYDFLMPEHVRRIYEKLVIYCNSFVDMIPLSFILGFYVSFTASRWWNQYTAIPWPDKLMNTIALYIGGTDETSRMLRRTLVRYTNLTLVLVLRAISIPVKRRFPTKEHLVEAGFMTKPELEMYSAVPTNEFNTFWVPCTWFVNLLRDARNDCRITDTGGLKLLMEELNEFRTKCGLLWSYDWVSIPLVYTQVVTVATYAFFIASLFGRQDIYYADKSKISFLATSRTQTEYYVPVFSILQFLMYMGLLKLGEQLINPFGDDDEDFELNWIIDRHIKVSFLGVDILNCGSPPLMKDNYFYDTDIQLPYTEAALAHKVRTYKGSVAHAKIPFSKQNLVLPEFESEESDEDNGTPVPSLVGLMSETGSCLSLNSAGDTERKEFQRRRPTMETLESGVGADGGDGSGLYYQDAQGSQGGSVILEMEPKEEYARSGETAVYRLPAVQEICPTPTGIGPGGEGPMGPRISVELSALSREQQQQLEDNDRREGDGLGGGDQIREPSEAPGSWSSGSGQSGGGGLRGESLGESLAAGHSLGRLDRKGSATPTVASLPSQLRSRSPSAPGQQSQQPRGGGGGGKYRERADTASITSGKSAFTVAKPVKFAHHRAEHYHHGYGHRPSDHSHRDSKASTLTGSDISDRERRTSSAESLSQSQRSNLLTLRKILRRPSRLVLPSSILSSSTHSSPGGSTTANVERGDTTASARKVDPKLKIRPFRSKVTFAADTKAGATHPSGSTSASRERLYVRQYASRLSLFEVPMDELDDMMGGSKSPGGMRGKGGKWSGLSMTISSPDLVDIKDDFAETLPSAPPVSRRDSVTSDSKSTASASSRDVQNGSSTPGSSPAIKLFPLGQARFIGKARRVVPTFQRRKSFDEKMMAKISLGRASLPEITEDDPGRVSTPVTPTKSLSGASSSVATIGPEGLYAATPYPRSTIKLITTASSPPPVTRGREGVGGGGKPEVIRQDSVTERKCPLERKYSIEEQRKPGMLGSSTAETAQKSTSTDSSSSYHTAPCTAPWITSGSDPPLPTGNGGSPDTRQVPPPWLTPSQVSSSSRQSSPQPVPQSSFQPDDASTSQQGPTSTSTAAQHQDTTNGQQHGRQSPEPVSVDSKRDTKR